MGWGFCRILCLIYIPYRISMQVNGAILRPLANPETLKNLPMCNFEKPAHGNGTLFQNHLEKHPNTHPRTPRRPRRGVFGWVFGTYFQTILKKNRPIFNNHRKYEHPCFSKLHIYRFFKVSGFPKGRRMPIDPQEANQVAACQLVQ